MIHDRPGAWGSGLLVGIAALALLLGLTGCERKERIIDIKTPAVDIEVDRDKDSGRIDIDVDTKRKGDR